MSRRSRRNHPAPFKAKAASATIKGERTLSELAQQCDVHAKPGHTAEESVAGGSCWRI